ncbi:hypothetical protein GCM10010112_93950 [Actinoplanes lobatus]|uniref:Uncharacterized protein n=1 Tax=Actinoplanes lobatus TaxID=113568 RepID=A0A7W7HL03_9ACTN|nr:hypothetical protein [Actinoplanes lobatus]MBB4752480.1 hypothetical protein [Actinoplanes lobatus]GGN99817.1 hypothetical protein GCM10010112_93950 [Actinoplanes lobatus]GIE46416.1 hypothetical protein Alo02nite_93140 [Actinoplanes lobatus]
MVQSVLEAILSGPTPRTRTQVLTGESSDPARRGDKKVVAFSDCRYRCADFATLVRCVDAIKDSDDKLRARPDDLMLWDWDDTHVQFDNPDDPRSGGGIVFLGVAWYDMEFFTERGGAGFSRMHRKVYELIGIPEDAITIQHFLCADVARFTATEDVPDSPAALAAGATI